MPFSFHRNFLDSFSFLEYITSTQNVPLKTPPGQPVSISEMELNCLPGAMLQIGKNTNEGGQLDANIELCRLLMPHQVSPPPGTPETGIRISNRNSFIPITHISGQVTNLEYRELQKLGQTNDPSLIAKLIGIIGKHYRLRVLRDQELYGFRTDSFCLKETICQNAFTQLELLFDVEQHLNRNLGKFHESLVEYRVKILLLRKTFRHAPLPHDKNRRKVALIYKSCLDHAEEASRKLINQLRKEQKADPKYFEKLDNHLIEDFLRGQAAKALDAGSHSNDQATLAGKFAWLNGMLGDAFANAGRYCTAFRFDSENRVMAQHQGIFTQEMLTVDSRFIAGQEASAQQDYLLSLSAIMAKRIYGYDAFNYKLSFKTGFTRSWQRIYRRIFKPDLSHCLVGKLYKQLLPYARKADLNFLKIALEDVTDLFQAAWGAFKRSLTGAVLSFAGALYKLYMDFRAPPKMHPLENNVSLCTPLEAMKIVAKLSNEQLKYILPERWREMSEAQRWRYTFNVVIKKLDNIKFELPEKYQTLLASLNHQDFLVPKTTAALAIPPYQIGAKVSHDILSTAVSVLEAIATPFDEFFEANPTLGLIGASMYAVGGYSAIDPDGAKAWGAAHGVSEVVDPFVDAQAFFAQLMSSSTYSQFTTSGFADMQLSIGLLQFLATPQDSVTGELLEYFKAHMFKVIAVFASAGAMGYTITEAIHVPYISQWLKNDSGKIPWIEQSAVGGKLMFAFYELFYSSGGERSIFGALTSEIFNWIILPLRCVLSPINLVATAIYNSWAQDEYQRNWFYIWRPWVEIYLGLLVLSLSVVEFIARVLNVVGLLVRQICKVITEVVLNHLALLVKFLFLTAYPGRLLATHIIDFKAQLFSISDQNLSRPTKNIYRRLMKWIEAFRLLREQEYSAICKVSTTTQEETFDPNTWQPGLLEEDTMSTDGRANSPEGGTSGEDGYVPLRSSLSPADQWVASKAVSSNANFDDTRVTADGEPHEHPAPKLTDFWISAEGVPAPDAPVHEPFETSAADVPLATA